MKKISRILTLMFVVGFFMQSVSAFTAGYLNDGQSYAGPYGWFHAKRTSTYGEMTATHHGVKNSIITARVKDLNNPKPEGTKSIARMTAGTSNPRLYANNTAYSFYYTEGLSQ